MDDVIDRVGWVDAFRVVNQLPRQFTWWANFPAAWTRNLGWRIDYQLVTPEPRRRRSAPPRSTATSASPITRPSRSTTSC